MSVIGFLVKSLAISPFVFLRYLPIFAFYVLLWVALLLSTDNIWVIRLLGFLLATYGSAFLIVTGLRAGLMTLKATTAPNASGLLNVTTRILFFHLLVMFLITLVVGAIVIALFYYVITPILAPGAIDEILALATLGDPTATFDPLVIGQLTPVLLLFSFASTLVGAVCFAIFGIPMAAVAANAVQYSPRNDMIFGLGRYMPHQVLVYLVTYMIPVILILVLAPATIFAAMAVGEAASAGIFGIVMLLYVIYAPCPIYAAAALGYTLVRGRIADERQAQKMPVVDHESERESLRSLRQKRTETTATASTSRIYDPRAGRGGETPGE